MISARARRHRLERRRQRRGVRGDRRGPLRGRQRLHLRARRDAGEHQDARDAEPDGRRQVGGDAVADHHRVGAPEPLPAARVAISRSSGAGLPIETGTICDPASTAATIDPAPGRVPCSVG